MKCIVCCSEMTEWVETIMHNETEGYEAYVCQSCRSRSEYGIKIVEYVYTGENDVSPYEQE